jgi:N-acetyl-anhydromuramyl-L-alanine amidase AmpD
VSAIVLPPLEWRHSPNRSSRHGTPIRLLVWHESAGHYAGDLSWLCNPAARASAHLVVREDGLEATQLVKLEEKAWHADQAFNPGSIGVEHSNLTAKGFASERQLEVSARIFGWLCLEYGIPPRWSRDGSPGVCRHLDLGAAGGGHTQCGPGNADWLRFLKMLHHELERGDYKRDFAR